MEVSEINFCNINAFNVKNNREKSDILKKIYTKYRLNIADKSHKMFTQRHLTTFKSNEHLVSTITQGNKYWLFLTKINNENYSLFIDNKITDKHILPKIIIVNFRFSNDLFTDTLFEGELVRDKNNQWLFILTDLLIYKAQLYHPKNIIDKISLMYEIMKTMFINDMNIQPCFIQIKKHFTYKDLKYLVDEYIPKLQYKILGVIFQPVICSFSSVEFYFKFNNDYCKSNFEFLKDINSLENSKNQEKYLLNEANVDIIASNENIVKDDTEMLLDLLDDVDDNINIDSLKDKLFTFEAKKLLLPNLYALYTSKNGTLKKHSIARIDRLECATLMEKIFKERKSKYLVDCYYYKDFGRWVPSQVSSSKDIVDLTIIKDYIKTCN